jgi:hypothetical protein
MVWFPLAIEIPPAPSVSTAPPVAEKSVDAAAEKEPLQTLAEAEHGGGCAGPIINGGVGRQAIGQRRWRWSNSR